MTQIVNNYATVLYELGIKPELVEETKKKLFLTKELQRALENPVISKKQKHRLIDRIFDRKMVSFLKILCDYDSMQFLPDIFKEYEKVYQKQEGITGATLYYVTEPSDQQKKQMLSYLVKRFGGRKVQLKMKEQPELVGGFILRIGDLEMDWSLRGRFKRLEQKLVKR